MTEFKVAIPAFPVGDIKRSTAFYADNLGFKIVHEDEMYAVMGRDKIELHLWAATDDAWKTRAQGKPIESGAESFLAGTTSCRILVDTIEQLYQGCCDRGIVHPNGKLETKWYGMTEFAILDPDNNLVTFFQPSTTNT